MHNSGPETTLEPPGAEIPQFMTLVSCPAPHYFALLAFDGVLVVVFKTKNE